MIREIALALALLGRPGGGESFSGGSSYSGGSGGSSYSGGSGGSSYSSGSDDWSSSSSHEVEFTTSGRSSDGTSSRPLTRGELMFLFMVAGAVILFGFSTGQKYATRQRADWETREGPPPPIRPRGIPRSQLAALRAEDPEFSVVLFEDFVYLLYAEVQRARGQKTTAIGPFLSLALAAQLRHDTVRSVTGVIIGSMRFTGLAKPPSGTRVEVEIEANLTEQTELGELRYWVRDRMKLQRASGARSRPWKRARTLDCPNCGAPLSSMRGTTCGHCGADVGGGRFDWQALDLVTDSREPRGPLLTSSVEEAGTDLPTVFDPGLEAALAALEGFDQTRFLARVQRIFAELHAGWSERDAKRIRPFVTDNLLQSMVYWIDLYLAARCRNINLGARIEKIEIASAIRDAHYDAITARVFARGADHTISDDGKILSGSREKIRAYSEYWTLVRGREHADPRPGLGCPSCGAPLAIGMTGSCDHCGVKVTAGEFDWVLSRIEQDEVYAG